MIKVFHVHMQTGEIVKIFEPSNSSLYEDGVEVDGFLQKTVPIETDHNHFSLYKYWNFENNAWDDRTERPSMYHQWSVAGWVLNSENLFARIRNDRDILLKQSDWTQLPDSPLTDTQKAEWATYRQALRDVPINNSNVTSLEEVVWPTEPA